MGVKGLWKLIEAAGMPVALETLEHKVLGVDISIWLHQAVRGWKGPGGDSVANAHLLTLFHRVCKLLFYRIRPVFVFDGGVPYLKKQTLSNRRLRREIAASKAKKVRERLLNNLLKSQAVRQALGKHGPGPAAFHVPKAPRKADMFELPPMPVKEEKEVQNDKGVTSIDSDSSDDDQSSLLLNINVPNLHQFDLESKEFKSMPLETQSIVLSELALTRKQNSWGTVNEMPEEGGDFSSFQMGRLLKRRNFQKTIEEVQGELQKKNVAEMEAEMFGELEKHASLSQRIESEDNAMSILVKKTPEKVENKAIDYKGKSLMKKKQKIQKDFLKELASKGLSFSNNQDAASKDDSKKFDMDDSFSDESEDDFFKDEKKESQDLMRIMDTVVDNSGLTQEELLAIIKQDSSGTPQKVNQFIDDQPSTSSNAGGFIYNSDADSSSENSNDFVEIVDNVRKKLCKENEQTQDSNIDAILSTKSNSLYLKIVQDRVNDMLHTKKIGKTALVDTRKSGSTPVKDNLTTSKTHINKIETKDESSYKKNLSFVTTENKIQSSVNENEATFDNDESSDDDFIEVPPLKDSSDSSVHLSNSQNKKINETTEDSSSDDDDFIEVPIPNETIAKPENTRQSTGIGENISNGSNKVTLDLSFGPTIVKDDLFADLFPIVGNSSLPVTIDKPNLNGRIDNGHTEVKLIKEKETHLPAGDCKKYDILPEVSKEKTSTGLPSGTKNEIDPELKRRIDELVKLEVEKMIGKKIEDNDASSSKLNVLDNKVRSTAKESELMDTSDSDEDILAQSSNNKMTMPSTPNLSDSSKGSTSAPITEESEEFDSAEDDVMLTEEYSSSCMFVKDALIPEHMKVPFIMPSKSNITNEEVQSPLSLATVDQSVKENVVETGKIGPKSDDLKSVVRDNDNAPKTSEGSESEKIFVQEKDSVLIEPGSSKSVKKVQETDSVFVEAASSKSSNKLQDKDVEKTSSIEMEDKEINRTNESPAIAENEKSYTTNESIEQPLQYSEDELKLLEGNLAEEHQLLVAQAQKVDRVASNLSDQMYVDAQELLQLFGLPYLVAPMEAEAQCAFLDYMNMTQGSITDDSDVFLFGGTRVYKNMFNQNRQVEFFNTLNVENHFNLSRDKLITLALLTGSDYTEGIETVGAVSGMEIIAEFPGEGLECLQNMKKWWVKASNSVSASHPSGIRQKLSQLSLPESFPNPDVFKAYIEPDVDDSTEKFTWSVPNVNALRAFTTEKFGWSMAKSNEILTPVIKRLGVKETQMRIDSYFTSIKLVKETAVTSKRLQDAICRVKGEEPPPKAQSEKNTARVSKKRGASNANSTSRRKKSKLMEETLDTDVVENIDMDDPDDPSSVDVSDSKITSATSTVPDLPEDGSSSSNVSKRKGPAAMRIPTEVSEVHSKPKKKLTKEEFKEEMFKAMLNREGITQVQNDKKEMEEKKKKAALLLKNKPLGKKGNSRK